MIKFDKKIQEEIEEINHNPAIINILEVICQTTGMGFAVVARVTEKRWIALAVKDNINFGLTSGGELNINTTICNEILKHHEPVVVDNFEEDEMYKCHQTPLIYGLKSYISFPIFLKNGDFFGTLCAIDPNPAKVKTAQVRGMFNLFTDLISFHLNAMEEIRVSQIKLEEERKEAKFREQFIAILGHDLRNPVGAINSAVQLQLRLPLDERTFKLAKIIQDSSKRTIGLINTMLDLAQGKLGRGIALNYTAGKKLENTLNEVITELRTISPDRVIEVEMNLKEEIRCDHKRVAQLFSNVLGNALTHGAKDQPVVIRALSNEKGFELIVTNPGTKIPEETMNNLFKPFSRGEITSRHEGLGLGLYIASEIARAHHGKLEAKSNDEYTSMTFSIEKNNIFT
ncbi:sensor histidine kinase [Arcticibacter svalbardensis MN12-7]|uniref:histidine kinase n=1 Tax=Arcticibacter svalbardensis MN12-7 TaxID=1150600 RepID=R9GTN1_9SPHI|nr:GAF domain-containing sensor histidine kinase [Arcticibacter svalbardensis]EOR94910.1 sensor histidine kinase [Arcticibacter svalbardensis MN12-7]